MKAENLTEEEQQKIIKEAHKTVTKKIRTS
jgi:hypothetical protein